MSHLERMRVFEDSGYREVVGRVCDLCGGQTQDRANWSRSRERYEYIIISRTTARKDGRDYCNQEFHLCPGCFEATLVPFLVALGVTPTVEMGT